MPIVLTATPTKTQSVANGSDTKTPQKLMQKMLRFAEPDPINEDGDQTIRPLANVLLGIGIQLTKQSSLAQLIRQRNRKLAKAANDENQAAKEEGDVDRANEDDVNFKKVKTAFDKITEDCKTFIFEKKVTCGTCSFSTSQPDRLRYHKEYAHDQELAHFNCALCDYISQHSHQFLDHMHTTHKRRGRLILKSQVFCCTQCQYETSVRPVFERHSEKCNQAIRVRCLAPVPSDRDFPVFMPQQKKVVQPPQPKQVTPTPPSSKPRNTPTMKARMPNNAQHSKSRSSTPVPTGTVIPSKNLSNVRGQVRPGSSVGPAAFAPQTSNAFAKNPTPPNTPNT